MVKHLPTEKRKKALFYGLMGAFVLRCGSLFIISFLVDVWQVQALGAIYLMYIAGKNLLRKAMNQDHAKVPTRHEGGYWMTVFKLEMSVLKVYNADVAVAVDCILAAVALAVALRPSG